MFKWNITYETGICDIDQQHQELFRIGEDLYRQLENNPGSNISEDILDCLENLAMYAAYHFDTEESLLNQFGYYDCEEHIAEHRSFIDHLERFDLDQIDHNQDIAVRGLLRFISQWISEHISKTDFKYTAFVKEQMDITA